MCGFLVSVIKYVEPAQVSSNDKNIIDSGAKKVTINIPTPTHRTCAWVGFRLFSI